VTVTTASFVSAMDDFKEVMTDDEVSLYILKPPTKDVAKRLPPTRMPSFNSQLVAIKESPKEVVIAQSFSLVLTVLDFT
jgi:hypothetical protein